MKIIIRIGRLAIMSIAKHVISPSLDQVVHTFIRQLDLLELNSRSEILNSNFHFNQLDDIPSVNNVLVKEGKYNPKT